MEDNIRYEVEGDSLKIITPVVELVSIDELYAEKTAIEFDLETVQYQYTERKASLMDRLDIVSNKISMAESKGLTLE